MYPLREYVPPRRQSNPSITESYTTSSSSSNRRRRPRGKKSNSRGGIDGRSISSRSQGSEYSHHVSLSDIHSQCFANDQPTHRKGDYRSTSRRKRRTSELSESYHYRSDNCKNGHENGIDNKSTAPRQRRRIKRSVPTISISITKLSRIVSVIIVCTVIYFGVGLCISIAKGAINVAFGSHNSMGSEEHEDQTSIYDEDKASLRGASQHAKDTSDKLSVHDLNAKSHLLKAEGRNMFSDEGKLELDKDGEGDKEYMGHDITHDFFYAGDIVEKGRPAHTYADIPYLLDSNPFSMSIWVNLPPSSDNEKDGHQPRVILSTKSKGYLGCLSKTFGETRGTGIVLYAQPVYQHSYRIVLEYADTTKKSCQKIISWSNQNDELLIHEDEWYHIVIFATRSFVSKEGNYERLSMYINGDLAGRNDHASREISHMLSKSRTLVGRYAGGSSSSSNHFGLGGQVGMLSFWETGGHALLSKLSTRMSVKTVEDEDHVVRSIQRASFDISAIKELSLLGLFIKKPTLLYAFQRKDVQKEIMMGDEEHTVKLPDLSSELPAYVNCKDLMSGKDGQIMLDMIDGNPPVAYRPNQ